MLVVLFGKENFKKKKFLIIFYTNKDYKSRAVIILISKINIKVDQKISKL